MTTKTTSTKSATKICPFCANKINAKAIKCQFCKEFLGDELDPVVKNQIEKTSSGIIEASKSSTITAGKVVIGGCILMFVRIGIALLGGLFGISSFLDSEAYNIIDNLITFVPIILFMIRCNRGYQYLLNKNTKNIRYNSTGWPTWGWICPIACLFVPYQAVRDIYKITNKNKGIIGWRWGCYLMSSFLIRLVNKGLDDDSGIVALIGVCVLIATYILTINIVNHVNESL